MSRKRIWILGLLLAALTLAAYAPVVRNGFITLDDDKGIYANPQVQQGLTWETARWALTTTEESNWYPLRRLSHLADVSVFGMWAGGLHLVSALWHAAAAALLLAALWSMTGALWRSLFAAALFALHPLQVESVAWAIERSNVMSGFFFALTLLLWTRYTRRPGAARYGAAVLAFAVGLVAKPNLMAFPFLLLVLDAWPLGRLGRPGGPPWRIDPAVLGRRILEKVPLLALSAGAGAIAVVAHSQQQALSSLEALPLQTRFANAALSYWRYLGKLVWPVDLAAYYPYPVRELPVGPSVAAGALLAAVTVMVLASGRTRPWLAVGWLWFLGMLAPMIGIVQFGVHAMADRFAYLALIGAFVGLAWSAGAVVPRGGRGSAVASLAAIVALLGCFWLSVRQVGRWRDSLTLYEHTLAVTGENWKIEFNLANELRRHNRKDDALEHYFRSYRIITDPGVTNNLGAALLEAGRYDEALVILEEAVRLNPANADFRENLSLLLEKMGRREAAARQMREVERLRAGR